MSKTIGYAGRDAYAAASGHEGWGKKQCSCGGYERNG